MAVSREPTCRLPNGNILGNRPVGSPTAIVWGADKSAPQRQIADLSVPQRKFAGKPTGLLPNARYPTCRCGYAGEPTCLGSNADVRLVVADLDLSGSKSNYSVSYVCVNTLYERNKIYQQQRLTRSFVCHKLSASVVQYSVCLVMCYW